MATFSIRTALAAALFGMFATHHAARAATTIDPVHKYAYSANLGWVDWSADTTNGAVIGEYVCSGFIYSPNAGWINLGSGTPTNGIYYQNLAAGDFGVNQDGAGNLRGYAYGANIGWISFENLGAPKFDLITGRMSGCVWSANCGWISLSNAVAYLQTDSIAPDALAPNGLPIAWLLNYFGTTDVNANADPDGDGIPNYQEYRSGTSPVDGNDYFAITAATFTAEGTQAWLSWNSVPTRIYAVQKTSALDTLLWGDSGLGLIIPSAGPSTSVTFMDVASPYRFYRVQALRPLFP